MSRSKQMACIKGEHTTPERRLRSSLWARGLRYRIHVKMPAGRPDIVFSASKVAVFIDGCFWHGCPIHYTRPRSRHEFWAEKLAANVERDRRQTLLLEAQGWVALRFWEHQTEDELEAVCEAIERCVRKRGHRPLPCWRVWRVDLLQGTCDAERRYLVDLRDVSSLRRAEEGPRYSRSGPKSQPKAVRIADGEQPGRPNDLIERRPAPAPAKSG
jgi:DNA mismatch endonuclease, patch repair protein